ncbi:MAG: hypothetical protein ABI528_01040 [bacterium]
MKKTNFKNTSKIAMMILTVIALAFNFTLTGCNDSNVAGLIQSSSTNSAGGESTKPVRDTTSIYLDMSIQFKSENITESKMLESNTGNQFNHIVRVDRELKPNEILNLEELQPTGIFGLYLSATGTFTLTNSNGLSLNSKSILLEKCQFIDMLLKNQEAKSIHVTGFVAGE